MYDAIVIGARCAGSPTAMLLARKGHRVLLVDKATFPSDTLSTLVVWPHGAERLDRWGLLDAVAASNCPPIARNMVFDVGPFALRGAVTDTNRGRGGFCPRRTLLDKLLVDAAAASGAEVREGFAVDSLIFENDAVVGMRGRSRGGGLVEERARVVVGADGLHSLVAKAVRAEEYDAKPPLATYFYSYYSGFEAEDVEQYTRDYEGTACFPTNDGLTLIAGVWPASRFGEIRADPERHVSLVQRSAPSVADRMQHARREEKWMGTAGVANYFRKPYGPGWALVGDAAYDKDPLTAQGISDAFADAESLVEALDAALSGRRTYDETLAEHQLARDRRAKPMYDFTCELATLAPAPPHMRQLFAALHGSREETGRFYSALTGSTPLPEFMNPQNLQRIVG
jgi:2-polyprenyl-6-methoxyphenol hydroxylase-like FAD-dependent oxidoreductase